MIAILAALTAAGILATAWMGAPAAIPWLLAGGLLAMLAASFASFRRVVLERDALYAERDEGPEWKS